jgi:hypothetical protein
MQRFLEHFGIAVSAVSGALAGRGKQVDLFGVLVLALVTAFGGGTVRDVMIGDVPVFWIRHPDTLVNAAVTGLITFFFVRYYEPPLKVLLVADAFALAFFHHRGRAEGDRFSFGKRRGGGDRGDYGSSGRDCARCFDGGDPAGVSAAHLSLRDGGDCWWEWFRDFGVNLAGRTMECGCLCRGDSRAAHRGNSLEVKVAGLNAREEGGIRLS